jgi:hypothetical protein
MPLPTMIFNTLSHDPQATLYFAQSAAYGLALGANWCGRPTPWMVYLASCLIHLALGLLDKWPPG